MFNMPGKSYQGELPPLSQSDIELQKNLKRHVFILGSDIGERNLWQYSSLQLAASMIKKMFDSFGYEVRVQEYEVLNKKSENIEVEIKGATRPDEIVVIGAHYDSVQGSPGANDNGTGVAALLELAHHFRTITPSRTLRFVAFTNEEPPIFLTDYMGSKVYARRSRERNENIVAMLSLETIGYYSDKKWSQSYPFPFMFYYPTRANFIGFVSNMKSRELLKQAIGSFREKTQFPSEGVFAPSWMVGVGWSDQWSFWKEGYPGIMVTDTALFRYPYYHSSSDLPDKIDYERMTRVVLGLQDVVSDLVNK